VVQVKKNYLNMSSHLIDVSKMLRMFLGFLPAQYVKNAMIGSASPHISPVFFACSILDASSCIGFADVAPSARALRMPEKRVLNVTRHIFSFAELSLSGITASKAHAKVIPVPHLMVVSIALKCVLFILKQRVLLCNIVIVAHKNIFLYIFSIPYIKIRLGIQSFNAQAIGICNMVTLY
jgi:hypothetical protein